MQYQNGTKVRYGGSTYTVLAVNTDGTLYLGGRTGGTRTVPATWVRPA